MKVTDIIIILLFIVPGVIAEKISHWFSVPGDHKRSDFKETVNGIILSVPIVLLAGWIVGIYYKIDSISDFIRVLDSITFITKFSICVLTVSLILGILAGVLKEKVQNAINYIRITIFKKITTDERTCWTKFFCDEIDSMFLEVIKDGKPYKGFLNRFSLGQEEKEIILEIPPNINDYLEEFENCFSEANVKRVFINFEKNIVIKDYDTKEYKLWVNKKIKEVTLESSAEEQVVD